MSEASIVFVGSGASNVACARLIFNSGADAARCRVVDSKGILHKGRSDVELRKAEFVDKWKMCQITNAEGRQGGIPEAMKGADVVIALSKPGPGVILPEWVGTMAKDAIVFACANPVPEIWPWEAKEAGAAIVATGRSDFPNQVNNSLGFPGIFRGTLDVRATTITDEMCVAAAEALAGMAAEKGLNAALHPADDGRMGSLPAGGGGRRRQGGRRRRGSQTVELRRGAGQRQRDHPPLAQPDPVDDEGRLHPRSRRLRCGKETCHV